MGNILVEGLHDGVDTQSGVAFLETPIDLLRDCTGQDGLLGLLSLDRR